MRQWIYHDDFDAKIIDDSELDHYFSEGWRVSFRKPGECESPLPLPSDTHVELEDDLDALRRECAELEIKIDGRWGEARLREELTAAKEMDN